MHKFNSAVCFCVCPFRMHLLKRRASEVCARPLSSRGSGDHDTVRFFSDPSLKLQRHLQVPLFSENERGFNPSMEEMQRAKELFKPDASRNIAFMKSVVDIEEAPRHDLPEVVFLGRSNVGKSTMIKALLYQATDVIVRTSKTPGFTKTINFYHVGKHFCLVDVPGYGYRQPEHFISSVEPYLRQRKNLVRTFMLIDGKVGFLQWDAVALDMLEEFKIPYALIMTKVDKAQESRLLLNLLELKKIRDKQTTASCFHQPFLVSGATGEGIGFLMSFIAYITGAMPFTLN